MFVAKKEPPFRTAHLHRACAARKTAWIGSFVHAGMITSFMLSSHRQKPFRLTPNCHAISRAFNMGCGFDSGFMAIMSYPSPQKALLIPQWHHEVPKSIIA